MSETSDRRAKALSSRRQRDNLLAKERDILSAILNVAGALLAVIGADGRIISFNRACEEAIGVPASEAVGRFLWEVTNPPAEWARVEAFFRQLSAGKFPEQHEREWVHREGARILIQFRNTALYDAEGKLEFIIATGFDITESRALEAELKQRSWALAERVKELNCLYNISRLSESDEVSLSEFFKQVVALIPPAWQFPKVTAARISLGEEKYATPGFSDGVVSQSAPVVIDGAVVATIEVCYTRLLPEMAHPPFLPEEQKLLDNIAEHVGHIVLQHRALQRIGEYQTRLRSLASELALTGERERRRIAQELHDQVGHNLASIKYKLGELKKSVAADQLDEIHSLLERTIQVSRNLTFELSPPVLHELGLGAALEWLVHQLRANFDIAGEYIDDHLPKPLSADLRVELFQAVRELLVNVGKHSKASMAEVRAAVDGERLRIDVVDDGVGFEPPKNRNIRAGVSGWGLFSIRERLAHLGAEVAIQSAPGQGTRVTLWAPLQVEEPAVPSGAAAALQQEAAAVEMVTILLADDQALTRAGLRSLLEQHADLSVVAEAADGISAVELALEYQPDVVVMDIAMPKLNGIEATRRILAERPETRVIALSMHSDGQYVVEMLRAGATGYLLKDCAHEDLAQAIRIVNANLTFLSPGLADNVAADYVKGHAVAQSEGATTLTPRELEVLKLLAQGSSAKEIALKLKVSLKTVETHRQHIMEKLEIHNVAGLTRFAIKEGLIDLGD